MKDRETPSSRWRKITDAWEGAGLGEEPPSWLEEYPTHVEMTLEQLHSNEPIRTEDKAWAKLVEAFDRAGAGEPPSRLRPHATKILAALLEPEDDEDAK